MRLVFFLKRGDLDALDDVFWCRVGTSGGVGLPGGTVVVSSEECSPTSSPTDCCAAAGEYWFDGHFPAATRTAIIAANDDTDFEVVSGRTVAGNEFFLEQFRLDGAVCSRPPEPRWRGFGGWTRTASAISRWRARCSPAISTTGASPSSR